MKDILRLGAILLVIGAICSGLVGFVNEITKEPIARQEQETKTLAMQEVLSQAEEFEETDPSEGVIEAYIGSKAGEIVGYAMKVAPKGYGGAIEIMVGLNTDGVVQGIKVLSHSETPGLGANAGDVSFTGQFAGKAGGIKVVKGATSGDDEISAITGATITSKAVVDGVNIAVEYAKSKGGNM